jgi:7-cyano-7-deazaguanine reductase
LHQLFNPQTLYNSIRTYKHINRAILKTIPNPSTGAYEIKTKIPELTFLGVQEQPDFATIYLIFYAGKKIIELKSLKHYVYRLRNIVVSYEKLIMICNPGGAISSKLTIDSDWKARGGSEAFNDWKLIEDEWEVKM